MKTPAGKGLKTSKKAEVDEDDDDLDEMGHAEDEEVGQESKTCGTCSDYEDCGNGMNDEACYRYKATNTKDEAPTAKAKGRGRRGGQEPAWPGDGLAVERNLRDTVKGKGKAVRKCRICGCTEDNCAGCIKRTCAPCHWVEKDLCSACHDSHANEHGVFMDGDVYQIAINQNLKAKVELKIAETDRGRWVWGYDVELEGIAGVGHPASVLCERVLTASMALRHAAAAAIAWLEGKSTPRSKSRINLIIGAIKNQVHV